MEGHPPPSSTNGSSSSSSCSPPSSSQIDAVLAFAPLRAKAEEATATFYLEGNRELNCIVRKHVHTLESTEGKEESFAEIIFSFKHQVFGEHENKQLFLHWGVGNQPHEWHGISPEFQNVLKTSSQTNFNWGAAETTFPSPASSPPPIVSFSFPVSQAPAYICFLFHTQWNEWIRQQGGGNVVLPVQQLLNEIEQKKSFLDTIISTKLEKKEQDQKTEEDKEPSFPLMSPEHVKYWNVPVGGSGNLQVIGLTYCNAMGAAFELFTDFPAALSLYWSGANGMHESWAAPPADSLLGQPGVSTLDCSCKEEGEEEEDEEEEKANENAKNTQDEAHAADERDISLDGVSSFKTEEEKKAYNRKRKMKEKLELKKITCQFGGFASYPQDNKAYWTQFEFLPTPGSLTSLQRVSICLGGQGVPQGVVFLLREVKADRWFKDVGFTNFFLPLPTHKYWEVLRLEEEEKKKAEQEKKERLAKQMAETFEDAVRLFEQGKSEREQKGTLSYRCITLSDNIGFLDAYCYTNESTTEAYIHLTSCTRVPCVLHWGVLDIMGTAQTKGTESRWVTWAKEGLSQEELEKKREEEVQKRMALRGAPTQWICPPAEIRPEGTVIVDPVRAVQTPFTLENKTPVTAGLEPSSTISGAKLLQQLTIKMRAHTCPRISEEDPGVDTQFDGIACCLKEVGGRRWFRNSDGRDIQIRIVEFGSPLYKGLNADLVEKIVEAEVEWQHMTLMHRYNLMTSYIDSFNLKHDSYLTAHPNFKKRVEIQQTLAVDWSVKHYHSPDVLLPTTFYDLPHELVSEDIFIQFEDYKYLGAPLVEEEIDFWAWMYVWGRFAFLGLLDWQRNYNTKPKDLAHASEQLTYATARAWRVYPSYRTYIRNTLSTLGRGGAQGQAIRDRILDVMHKHKIPETAGHFYEQWHQKLHNNTTPDDVGICEAVIGFLESNGDKQVYWRILGEHNITRERLASYERKITAEPYMVHTNIGELINDFRAYLSILKDVHDALDIKKAFDYARQYLPHDAIGLLEGLVNELGSQRAQPHALSPGDAMGRFQRLAEGRKKILFTLNQGGGLGGDDGGAVAMTRELLFLDLALEQQQGVLLQGNASSLKLQELVVVLREMLLTASAHKPVSTELRSMYADWAHLGDSLAATASSSSSSSSHHLVEDSREAALLLKALADRVVRYVGNTIDDVQEQLGSKSVYLGNQVGTEKKVLDVFVDEVLRGSALFSLSLVVKRLEPLLRAAAMLPPWQLISIVERVQGELVSIDQLKNIQDKVFDTPTVLLCGAVSGEEEIPIGVQAVLVRSAAVSPDILSHVAVRARNAHVLVAVCFEKKVADELERLDKKWVAVICARDGSSLQVHDEEAHRPHPSLQRRASKLFNRQTTQSLFNEATLLGRGASFVEESRRKLHCQRKRSSGEGGGMSDDEKSHSKDKRGQTILLDGVQESEEEDEDNEEDEDILQLDQLSEKWCIPMNEFKKGVVGGKSNNIKRLSDVLDSSVLTPRSVALPFGCMQKTLADPSNKACLHQLATDVVELSPSSSSEEADKILSKAKGIMSHVELPQSLLQALEACMQTQDKATSEKIKQSLYQDGEGDKKNEELERLGSRPSMIDLWHRSGAEKCTEAIKAVWMSLFGLRPWVSLTKAGRKYSELNMAVLVQELMPAHCAFVLHSRNPFSDDPEEMYGELALGLGEVIVGNFAGRSLGWRMKRGGKPIVVAFPSKSECLTCPPCLIFRSDSNGEDLENFAGAGLFESIPAFKNRVQRVTYWNTKLVQDRPYRMRLLQRIGELAFTVQDNYGGVPQDIEGVVLGYETIALVQTRTQV